MATILIIEDNPANMKLASLLMTNAGHAVLTARDAETLIEAPRLEVLQIGRPRAGHAREQRRQVRELERVLPGRGR